MSVPPNPKLPPYGAKLGIFSPPPANLGIRSTVSRVKRFAPELQLFLLDDAPVFRPLLHSSNLSLHGICERKFYFSERLGLRLAGDYASALHTGSIFHEATARALQDGQLEELRKTVEKDTAILADEIRASADSTGILPNGKEAGKVVQQLHDDTNKALAMAECFFEAYPVNPAEYEVVAVEMPVTTMIAGIKRPVTGKLDLVLREKATGHLWLVDHKTAGENPARTVESLSYDGQLLLYRLLAMAAFPNNIVAGFIHQIIQKPTIKYCGKDADFDAYVGRVREWYPEREREAAIAGPARSPFLRSKVSFQGFHLPADFVTLLKRVDRAARANLKPANHPRCCNKYTCNGLGNMPPCVYRKLCGSRMSSWSLELMSPRPRYIQAHRDYPLPEPPSGPTEKGD